MSFRGQFRPPAEVKFDFEIRDWSLSPCPLAQETTPGPRAFCRKLMTRCLCWTGPAGLVHSVTVERRALARPRDTWVAHLQCAGDSIGECHRLWTVVGPSFWPTWLGNCQFVMLTGWSLNSIERNSAKTQRCSLIAQPLQEHQSSSTKLFSSVAR